MNGRSLLVAIGVAVLAGMVTVQPGAQPGQPPPPTFKTEANYVRVDAYPTKDGVPVPDLTEADFEVLEDKVPQKIDAFQHIVVRGNIAQETRREPNNLRESRAMLEDPNARAFVIFLDVNHVEVEASHRIRQPLVDALNGMIGADDLVAVMTPEMSARDLTFARKTTTIEGFLTRHWTWGEREQLNSRDPVEDQYRACYPGEKVRCPDGSADDDSGIYAEMIERRREKQTLDALEDLVRYLRGVREERKAVIAVTDGWRLLRPNPALARRTGCNVPTAGVYVDPRSGKPTTKAPAGPYGTSPDVCERDRQALAAIDDDLQFRQMLDEANRANTAFYPVDPRGLVVFDSPIVPVNGPSLSAPAPTVSPSADRAMLTSRLTSLRTLAEATDGIAIVDSNKLKAGFQRIVDDLSSYYLLGYYSSGRLDGKFHSISVRVKRPGVQVRARRGYLAATASDAARVAASASPATTPTETAESRATAAVVGALDAYAREVPLRLQAAAGWKPGAAAPSIWVVGEVAASAAGSEWRGGADADIAVMAADGATVASGRATIAAGARTFREMLTPSAPIPPGDYTIRVGIRATAGGSIPSRDTIHLPVPDAPKAAGAMIFRRGQATGNQDVPTADLRFRRNERIRVEIPAPDAASSSARLLDRNGKPLAVPVAAALVDDRDGVKWATAQVVLAPLAAGDYVIELSTSTSADPDTPRKTLVAFRLTQ